MDELATFEINLTPQGHTVRLNGEDISALVQSINVAKPDRLMMPSVVLEIPSDAVKITGSGVAYFGDSGAAVDELLGSLNPVELEAEALMRAPLGASVTAAILEVIRERLRG